MARKESADSTSAHGFSDIIGVVLIAVAFLLMVSQLSFDPYDLSFIRNPPNHPTHNWIGTIGAHLAFGFFFVLGAGAYAVPLLVGAFGVAHLFSFLGYLRERSLWSVLWAAVLVLS